MSPLYVLSLLFTSSLCSAPRYYGIFEYEKLPPCAAQCLPDVEESCVPPLVPETTQTDYQRCACESDFAKRLQEVGTDCDYTCSEAAARKIREYILSLCQSGAVVTPEGLDAIPRTSASTLPNSSQWRIKQAKSSSTNGDLDGGLKIGIGMAGLVVGSSIVGIAICWYKEYTKRQNALIERIRDLEQSNAGGGDLYRKPELEGTEVGRAELATTANVSELDSKELETRNAAQGNQGSAEWDTIELAVKR